MNPPPKQSRRTSFILLAICIVAALIFWALHAQRTRDLENPSRHAACINNLRTIAGAKEQWAQETKAPKGAPANETAINEYIKGGQPNCPFGGAYTYNPIGVPPTCSWTKGDLIHALDPGDPFGSPILRQTKK